MCLVINSLTSGKKTHSKSKVDVAHSLPPLNIQVPGTWALCVFLSKSSLRKKRKKNAFEIKSSRCPRVASFEYPGSHTIDQPLRAFGKNAVALPLPRSPLLGDLDESSASTVAHERACILEHRVAYKTRGRRSFTKRAGAGKRCGAD